MQLEETEGYEIEGLGQATVASARRRRRMSGAEGDRSLVFQWSALRTVPQSARREVGADPRLDAIVLDQTL